MVPALKTRYLQVDRLDGRIRTEEMTDYTDDAVPEYVIEYMGIDLYSSSCLRYRHLIRRRLHHTNN
jgi:hypothetical protein